MIIRHNVAFLFIIGVLMLSSCRFNPNLQGEGKPEIQGTWEEGTVAYQDHRLQYQKHRFRFTCDSVYLTIHTFAKTKTYADSCSADGQWTEFAKGVYHTNGDTLMISATFTKPDFKQKISGCFRVGQYLPAFVIRQTGADTLKLEGLQDHLPITLALKERTTCFPKPLN